MATYLTYTPNIILSIHKFSTSSFDSDDLFYKPLNTGIDESGVLNNIFNPKIDKYGLISTELVDYSQVQIIFVLDLDYSQEKFNHILNDLFAAYKNKYSCGDLDTFRNEFLSLTLIELSRFSRLYDFYLLSKPEGYFLYSIFFEEQPNEAYWILTRDLDLRNTLHKIKAIEKQLRTFEENQPPLDKVPFKDEKTNSLFEYIVKTWTYDKHQKWADIYNVLDEIGYKMPFKNEYQDYIVRRFQYTGKFQYDKPKKDDNRDKQRLIQIIKDYSQK
jgi:hypothetical protein